MKNYRDSDYAVNKYASGIVYRFADQTVEVTLEDYLHENPGRTEADFAELKALSDEMYLEQDRADYRLAYKDVSLHGIDQTEACCIPSPENILIDQPEEKKNKELRLQMASEAFSRLTETQCRRYLLYFVKGLTTRKIAAQEGVAQQVVDRSILAAKKKMSKFLSGS